jgi:hypothetical protein
MDTRWFFMNRKKLTTAIIIITVSVMILVLFFGFDRKAKTQPLTSTKKPVQEVSIIEKSEKTAEEPKGYNAVIFIDKYNLSKIGRTWTKFSGAKPDAVKRHLTELVSKISKEGGKTLPPYIKTKKPVFFAKDTACPSGNVSSEVFSKLLSGLDSGELFRENTRPSTGIKLVENIFPPHSFLIPEKSGEFLVITDIGAGQGLNSIAYKTVCDILILDDVDPNSFKWLNYLCQEISKRKAYSSLNFDTSTIVLQSKMTDLCIPEDTNDYVILSNVHIGVNSRLPGFNHKDFLKNKQVFWNSIIKSLKKGGRIAVEDFEGKSDYSLDDILKQTEQMFPKLELIYLEKRYARKDNKLVAYFICWEKKH